MKKLILAAVLSLSLASPAMSMTKKVNNPSNTPVSAADKASWIAFSTPVATQIDAKRAFQDPDYAAWAEANNTANGAIVVNNNAEFQEWRTKATVIGTRICSRILGCAGY